MRCKQHASLCKHPTRFGNLLGTLIHQHHTNQNIHLVDILVSIHPAVGAVVPRAADGRLKDVGVVFAGWAEDVADVAHGVPSLLEPASAYWERFGKTSLRSGRLDPAHAGLGSRACSVRSLSITRRVR